MKLSEYLSPNDLTINIRSWCRKIGISAPTLYNLVNGRDIRLSSVAKIEKGTKGKVTCLEIYEEFVEKKSKKKNEKKKI